MKNEEIKTLFEVHTKAIKAEVKATTDLLSYKLDEVIEHQKETNGRVTRLECDTVRVPKKDRKFVAFGFVASVALIALGMAWGYHHVNWKKTFTNKTKIELNEKD